MLASEPDNEPKPFTAPPQSNGQGAPSSRGANSPFAPAASAATGASVIGTDLTILGDDITVISQNRLQVDGDIRGNVHGKQVLITEEGSVVGTVCAERVEVRGGVRGSIRGINVALQNSARVEGDITHNRLAISEGAHIDGHVRKSSDMSELTPVLDPEKISSGGSTSSNGPNQ
jgi:cytoskeletal protein CcmA (bactofilin family)